MVADETSAFGRRKVLDDVLIRNNATEKMQINNNQCVNLVPPYLWTKEFHVLPPTIVSIIIK